jgi:hypothetical protein
MKRRQAKLARSAGASPAHARSSKPPGSGSPHPKEHYKLSTSALISYGSMRSRTRKRLVTDESPSQ